MSTLHPRAGLATVLLIVTIAAAAGDRSQASAPSSSGCPASVPSDAYVRAVDRALRSRRDVWGNALLAAAGGPTAERARRYLAPLFLARGPGGMPLTRTGAHYVAFGQPADAVGSGTMALHVADGSQILSKRVAGSALTVRVGIAGRELYGSCRARLAPPRLASGYLPILQTRYLDAQGTRYVQESFAARGSPTGPLVSFVSLSADARRAHGDSTVRLALPGESAPLALRVPVGRVSTVRAAWPHASGAEPELEDAAGYDEARAALVAYWTERLEEGATIEVPERRVQNAVRNLLVQDLGLGWRYSVGNPYQQLSFPEGLDVAQVLSAYGYADAAAAILRRSLSAPRAPYPSWRMGQKLVATATHYLLFRDRAVVASMTPDLRRGVGELGRRLDRRDPGLLGRERYSSDISELVYGLHAQAVVWQGLRLMGFVWSEVGPHSLAVTCRKLAALLGAGLRAAIVASQRRLHDGSLFVPTRLLDRERPYGSVTTTRAGSYWNLVVPYALASGLFRPHSPAAKGVLAYLDRHGARLLGTVRSGAYSLYGRGAAYPVSGANPVYGLNAARFLADNDRPDRLVLALYGQLAVGMTPGTFVAGEAVSVAPLDGDVYRATYLPPNAASNASFLETLRLMLVHERRDRRGVPSGLELGFSTPRAWLAPGKRIAVHDLPTSFGRISFAIAARTTGVHALLDVPSGAQRATLHLRFRLPAGAHLAGMQVNGVPPSRFDSATGTVDLSGLTGTVEVRALVER